MRRALVLVTVIALLLVLGFIYYALDPATNGAFPHCAILSLTGYKCPGCGSQRAVHALLNGDVAAAFKYNAMLLISIPWVAVCFYGESQRERNPRLYARLNPSLLVWLFLAAVLAWWVLRNVFNW